MEAPARGINSRYHRHAVDRGPSQTPADDRHARVARYVAAAAALKEAVKYMASGGVAKAPNADPLLRPVALSDAETDDVVAFLEALSCPGSLETIGDQSVPWSAPAAAPAAK